MKRIALYIILFSYGMLILSPVTPYISDLIAHSFYASKHMATVHFEDGKLHVHQEVMDKAAKEEPAKQAPASKKDNPAQDHITLFADDREQYLQSSRIKKSAVTPGLAYIYLFINYPPPRA